MMRTDTTQPAPTFSWAAHPAAERIGHAMLAGLVVVAMAGVIAFSFESIMLGVIALLVLIAALNRFYFPSTFQLDKEGITARYPLRRKRERWDRLRRFVHDEYGGYLSSRAQPSRLDAYRGIHLLFGQQREAAIKHIHKYMASGEAKP